MSKFKYPIVCPVCRYEVEPSEIERTTSVKGYDITCLNCGVMGEIWLYSDEVAENARRPVIDVLAEEGDEARGEQ